ncbi:phospholipase A and acyltransferase 4-like [Oncorhynchus nerka]|uniref:phospholipase A and acyltransferase 4-like n=1 Tax=Oncorhynchus nerka TaxID=8023 RepID=UPI0031B82AD2
MQFGDMIEIDRGRYNHWALYIGNGTVIHVVVQEKPSRSRCFRLCSSSSSLYSNATITVDTLNNVAGQNRYQINNYLNLTAREDTIIKKDVEKMRGHTIPYNLLERNCEHFVTFLRYGQSKSKQVDDFLNNVLTGTAGVLGALTAFAASTAAAASTLSK